mmetsp:Transcript_7675/g.10865  ORF Transcript_7675/g.10865 Transcript_7675/m.10865 type:complete len:97 (-) Transcript_7675:292-582(-)|eukprot:CAMPEP_0185598074 /NCGR_PEP_ID=MMETSP0434-20130131/81770_1 /TAXON_ID=626734 ORGANISM="Favella taraikaensis, Strain Fe Narragansett Bay" /NCGR_SAMPLE_ID=MMETSP0434 /ASSEMBLY_ACC=CAM_ASM_000379 /LENGTH=96 /DNA_ID=CAMNT_0028226971 /DNA_START=1676 /DNA_END=1966 /DNA_ORIENTATION=-
MAIPSTRANRSRKVLLPATKEVMKESKRRHTKRLVKKQMQTARELHTPMPEDLFQENDDYLEMSSEEDSFARNAINRETFEQMNDEEEDVRRLNQS